MPRSFYARYSILSLTLLAIVAAFSVFGARKAMQNTSNRVEDWLPDHFQETRDLNWFNQHFTGDDILMISWEGCTPDDPRVGQLAKLLRDPADLDGKQNLLLFRNVVTADEVISGLRDAWPEAKKESIIQKLEGWLIGPSRHEGHRNTCIVAMITFTGWHHRHSLIDHIYDCADKVDGLSADTIHMAGQTRDGVEIDNASEQSLQKLVGLSLAICFTITLICFRSLLLSVMVISAAILNQQLSLALVYYTGSSMDSILLMVPSLVFVLSVSTAVHLVNYYRDAVVEVKLDQAAIQAVRHGWMPCLLASGTTALGLVSLLVSFLVPIKKFGGFAAAGILIGTGTLFLLVPSLLEQFPPRRWAKRLQSGLPPGHESEIWHRFRRIAAEFYVPIIFVAICLLVAGVWGVAKIRSTARIHDMFSSNARIIQDYQWLEDNIGPLVSLEVVLEAPALPTKGTSDEGFVGYPMLDRMRLVQRVENAIAEVKDIEAVVSAATFVPPLFPKTERVRWRAGINRGLSNHLDDYVSAGFLRRTNDVDLWRISARVKASIRHDYAQLYEELKRKVDEQIRPGSKYSVPGVRVVYSGSVPVMQKAQQQLLDDLRSSFALAFLLIAVAMVALLKSLPAGLISMIPNVLPTIVVFGAMGWLGVNVEVGSMMTATAAMGIAVDDTLHYLTWFRRGLQKGQSREEAVQFAYSRCGTAMVQTTLICGLGLLVFVLSPFGPISRFACLMFAMLSAALVGDLFVLPALLISPLGRVFQPRRQTKVA